MSESDDDTARIVAGESAPATIVVGLNFDVAPTP